MRTRTTMTHMATVYRRRVGVMRQSVKPQLPSWDRAGHPSQVKLARFLAHLDAIAGPLLAPQSSRGPAELIVASPGAASLLETAPAPPPPPPPVPPRLSPHL